MPYINQKRRNVIEYYGNINARQIESAGELQFAFAILIKEYLKKKGLCYQTCNDIMGALTGADKEFYRRVVIPYENKKIKENKDIPYQELEK